MKGIRLRFVFWILGGICLYLLANVQLRIFPHILIIFWVLLPILSFIFSWITRNKLACKIVLEPNKINRGEKGAWYCQLTNNSKFMAFFLRFPGILKHENNKYKPYDIMLRPGENRTIRLFFELPYTGTYYFDAKEPIFEDLLGFFWLGFSSKFKGEKSTCNALPMPSDEIFSESQQQSLDNFTAPVDRKSLSSVTDEVFSVEPLVYGQSLAHAHWKLSARLQQWMIKHYSELEKRPLRIIIDVSDVNWNPDACFDEVYSEPVPEDTIVSLKQRTHMIDVAFAISRDVLNHNVSLEVCDKSSEIVGMFNKISDIEDVKMYFSAIPFTQTDVEWNVETAIEQNIIILVQNITETTFGNLLRIQEQGIEFLLISVRSYNDDEINRKIENSNLNFMWIKEE